METNKVTDTIVLVHCFERVYESWHREDVGSQRKYFRVSVQLGISEQILLNLGK